MAENVLGRTLREHRERAGLTITDVANRAHIDRAYLHKLEGQTADWLNRPLYGGPVKQPSRDLIIRLIIALQLGNDEADELLILTGYAPLSARPLVDTLLVQA